MKTSPLLVLLFACLVLPFVHAAESPASRASAGTTAPLPADSPSKIHRLTPVHYPISMMRQGITHGEARILIHVDASGRLTEKMVLGYTHRPFADAALTALDEWRYEAPRTEGVPFATVVDITFRFEVDGVLTVERSGIPYSLRSDLFDTYVYKPHGLRTLDAVPTPIHMTQPIYPREWIDQGIRGAVTVDFYIDETGAVRMPSVSSTQNPLLAAAATAAVREWRFAPPLHRGRPVLAHCQQIFRFASENTPPKP